MSNYTKTTNFTAKDTLPTGDSEKIIRGAEFDTEFNNIATAVATKADLANPSFEGDITVDGTVDGRDVSVDGAKLDTIETNADVTDTANVTAAGAVMDSELTDEAAVKALDQGVATTDSPTFAGATLGAVTYAATDGTDGQVLTTDGAGNATFEDLPDSLYLNVKDFGATGDGTTDDTTAIQNAINHASNNEVQTIYFPEGHYKYTTLRFYHDAIDNPDFQETPNRDGRFQLVGTGRLAITDLKNVGKSPNRIYGSILESTSSGGGLIVEPTGTFQTTTDARNFVVKNLTLVADNTGYIVTAESCPGLTFDHCSFKQLNHQGSGILARNCWFFTMNQCYVFGQSWIDEAFATAGQTEFSYTFDNPASTSDIIVQKKGGLVSSSDYSINTTTKVVTLNTGANLNDKVTISRKNTGDGISSQFVGSAFGSFAGLWNITDSLVDSWANGVHWTGGQVTNLSLRNTGVQNCNNYNIYADAGVIQQMLLDNVYMENQSVQGVSFIKGNGSGTSSASIRNLRMINCFMLAGGTFPRVTGTCVDIDSIDVIDIEGMYVYRMRQPFLNIAATKNSQNVPGEIKNSIFATDQDLSAEPTIYLLSGKIPNVHNCVWPGFNDGFYDTTNDILLFDPSVESNFPRQFTDIKGTTGTAKFGFGDTKVVTGITSGPYNITGSDSRTYYDLTHSIAGGLKVILPDTGEVNDGRLIIIKNNEASTSTSQFPYINVVNNSDQNTTIGRLSPGQAGLFIMDKQSGNKFKYVGRAFTDDLELTDDHKITFGRGTSAGPDMEIYHDSTSGESRIDTLAGLTLDGLTYPTTDGTANQVLTTDGSGTLSFANVSGIGINAVVDDTTPQLGGNLDLNGSDITGTGNIDVTGTVTADSATIDGAMTINGAGINLDDAYSLTWGDGSAQVRGSGASEAIDLRTASTTRLNIDADGDISFYNSAGTSQDFFWDASTSRLGLGTTSPSYVVHASTVDNTIAQFQSTDNRAAILISDHDTDTYIGSEAGVTYISNTGGAYTSGQLVIDNVGNVGIGVTSPSYLVDAQSSGDAAIRIRSTGTGASDDSLLRMQIAGTTASNIIAFGDSDSSFAGEIRYTHNNNSMSFDTNGTERMRIDSSGNVAIGTSSTAEKLRVLGNIRADATSTEDRFIEIGAGRSGNGYSFLDLVGDTTYTDYGLRIIRNNSGANTTSAIQHRGTGTLQLRTEDSADISFDTATIERMRIDSSGNVLIKTSSHTPTQTELVVASEYSASGTTDGGITLSARSGGNWYNSGIFANGSALTFTTGDTGLNGALVASEKMRIDSSGNLFIGKTSASFGTEGIAFNTPNEMTITRDSGTCVFLRRNTADGEVQAFYKDTSKVGSISVTSSATAYNTSSDRRLKDNIVDAPSASDDIDAIQVRSFDWKADGSHQKYGMVAQELQSVAPEAVTGDADSDEMMGVDYSKLVPMLVKEIQSLRARVAQLEGAN